MKEAVKDKLKHIYRSLEAAKKYGVDVRMEDKKLVDCSIAITKLDSSVDLRYNIDSSDLKRTEREGYAVILDDLAELENTIFNKISIYQVKETLVALFEKLNNNEIDVTDFISNVKNQLKIFNNSKVSKEYRPDIVINEIFSIIYEAIKLEIYYNGNSELLEEVMMSESNLAKVTNFVNKDISSLEKIMGSNDENVVKLREYMSNINVGSKKKLVDEKLTDMVVDTISSYEVEDALNLQATNSKDELNSKLEEVKALKDEYTVLRKIQVKTERMLKNIKRSMDKKIAPFLLSIAILAGVGVGTYGVTSKICSDRSGNTITSESYDAGPMYMKSMINVESKENVSIPGIAAVIASLALMLCPKYGVLARGASISEDNKRYNNTINDIIKRKHEMEDMKRQLEEMVNNNFNYAKQKEKYKATMRWASMYTGLSATQETIINGMEDILDINSSILDNIDDCLNEEVEENVSRRIGC